MKRSLLLLIIGALACYLAAIPSLAQRPQLTYGSEKTTLTGRLISRTFYGPPNFGETPKIDARERQTILILDSAVDVIAASHNPTEETERRVTEVSLVLDKPVGHLIGRRVTVNGPLFHAHTGHHHTKVLMSVSSLKRK